MREKGQTEVAKTLETPVFSRGIEILTEKVIFYVRFNKEFQSTRPSRGETYYHALILNCCHDFNPLAPRGARHAWQQRRRHAGGISIHSPLAGRDQQWRPRRRHRRLFQSTRPSRGETGYAPDGRLYRWHFNPLAPRGARYYGPKYPTAPLCHFNPLAPRGATRAATVAALALSINFNPLAPRGARQ